MRRLISLLLALQWLPCVRAQTASTCGIGVAVDTLDANNVRATLYNQGGLFWKGAGNVFNVPKARPGQPITPNAIFAFNLWFGGYEGNELRQASAIYSNWEFIPGPLDAQGQPPSNCVPYDRIASVRLADLSALRAGIITEAVRTWPWQWGAPVVDGDGVPGNYNLTGGDRPELLGTETHWWVMNAMGPHPRTGSKPFPLEVQATAFGASTLPSFSGPIPAMHNSILVRYRLLYRGAAPMTDAYFGFFTDPDLGNATDDYVGSDTLLRMGYVYNADNFDEGSDGYGTPPPALGILALDGPALYDDDRDGRREAPGFTSFLYYNGCASSINCDPRPNTQDYYNFLRGRWQNGTRTYACGDGAQANYASCGFASWMFPGDPITRSFWSEFKPTPTSSVPNAPSDRRFAMGMGPLTLQPNVPVDVVLAFVWSRGQDHLDSVTRLKRDAAAMQIVWQSGGYQAVAQQTITPAPTPPALGVSDVTPNPLRTSGQITVSLPDAARVRAWVLDARGQTVARLVDGVLGPGTHALPIDARGWASGAYAVRVAVGSETVTRRFVVVR